MIWRSLLLATAAIGIASVLRLVQSRVQAPDAAAARARFAAAYEIKELKMAFVRIEPGEFLMGSPADEANRDKDEDAHRLRITRAFLLQNTEVTQAQWKAIMGDNASYFKGDDLPVDNVSWEDAVAFCKKLSQREGQTFRLPTEAEWEYACRADKQGPVAGTGKLDDMAWYADNSGNQRLDAAKIWDTEPNNYFQRMLDNKCTSHPCGSKKANDWGLFDMQGNVMEWCADWYESDYYSNSPRENPPGPQKSQLHSRLLRGGSWGSDVRHCRAADRDWNEPDKRSPSYGFRLLLEPTPARQ